MVKRGPCNKERKAKSPEADLQLFVPSLHPCGQSDGQYLIKTTPILVPLFVFNSLLKNEVNCLPPVKSTACGERAFDSILIRWLG